MYKPILAIEKKRNYMKRLAISFIPIIFFLFLMGNVDAIITWNSTYHALDVDTSLWNTTSLEVQYTNGSWFVGYFGTTNPATYGGNIRMGKFDDSFNRIDGFDIGAGSTEDPFTAINFQAGYQNDETKIYNRYEYVSGSFRYTESKNTSVVGLGLSSSTVLYTASGALFYSYEFAMTKTWDWTRLTTKLASIDGYSTTGANTWSYIDRNKNHGTLALPSSIHIGNASIFYEPKYDQYIVLGEDVTGTRTLYAIYYDLDFNYKDVQNLGVLGTEPKIDEIDGTVYITSIYNQTTVIISSYAPSTYQSCIIDGIGCTTKPKLNLVENQYVDLNISGSILSDMQVETPYLAYFYSKFLFYSIMNTTGGRHTDSINYIAEEVSCYCPTWQYTYVDGNKVCYSINYAEQYRTCYPRSCLPETQYVYDDWCNATNGGTNPEGYQQFQSICVPVTCTDPRGMVNPSKYPISSCQIDTTLPTNVSGNINATVQLIPIVDFQPTPLDWILGTLGDAKYSVKMCSPIESTCFNNSYLCQSQINISFESSPVSYTAGQQVHAYYEIKDAQNCYIKNYIRTGGYGWQKYQVNGLLTYCYNKLCGGKMCIPYGVDVNGNSLYESCDQYPDCNTNTTSCQPCQAGETCQDGNCQVVTTIPQGNVDIGTYYKGLVESSFPDWILTMLSIGTTAGISIVVYAKGLKDWKIIFGIMTGCILFFLTLTWLPSWLGVLWIMTIGIIFMKSIFFKGD